ncbi:MAG: 4Fe-4S dicluster domain-containing protein [Anaerolineae bacterium]|nr:4Fe-4S dicluster domain-containing protein [Anaerolineae bacterium]
MMEKELLERQDTSPSPSTPIPGSFLQEVIDATPGDSRLGMCIQCGTCGGSCPSAADMDNSPRQIFAMIRADMREEVLRSNTPWYCVSCYYCTVRCPQEVHITDVMYTLKGMAIREKRYEDPTAPDLSQTFISYVETYGRSFEFGVAARHQLRHHLFQLPSMVPFGLEMLTKGRMDLTPQRIEHIEQLQAILARARELEAS